MTDHFSKIDILTLVILCCLCPYSKSFEYVVYGYGPCPRVKPMQDFNITNIYGGKWYLIAHYSEDFVLSNNLHCLQVEFADENPGGDVCRIDRSNNSTVYGTAEEYRLVYEMMIPDPSKEAVWINTVVGTPVNAVVLATDYNTYIAWHECSHFPRDNPIVHEQHNYIHSRTAVWKDPKRGLKKAFDVFKSYDIDLKPFMWPDQQDCQSK